MLRYREKKNYIDILKIEGHLLHKGKEQSIVVRESHIGFDQELEQMKFQWGL